MPGLTHLAEPSYLAEIACLASNLCERRRIVGRLAAREAPKADAGRLDRFEAWKIRKLAEKLGVQSTNEAYRHAGVTAVGEAELEAVLTDYALYSLCLGQFSDAERLEFAEPHAGWVETYGDALATMDQPGDRYGDSRWRVPEVYHGSFGKVCEPFLRLLHGELLDVIGSAGPADGSALFSPQIVADVELHLLNRFELATAWAMETDINVYCLQNQIDKTQADPAEYTAYLESTFTDRASYHRFYCKFPVLGRWLAQVTGFLRAFGQELISRLAEDSKELSARFFRDRPVQSFRSFRMGRSDYHAGGKAVVLVDLELAGSETATVVYKPRGIDAEAAMQRLLRRLSEDGTVAFATYEVLCKEGYGYAEFIPSGRNHVETEAAIERLYRQLGGYLAAFYILGGTDLHFENILVADGNAFICDCETILAVVPRGMDVHVESFGDSVYGTGMLEWPRTETIEPNQEMRLSGYSGGESYELPFAVPKVNESQASLGVGVKYLTRVKVEQTAPNRIFFEGRVVDPAPYKECIADGFNRVYGWFDRHPGGASRLVGDLLANAWIRFVNWGTQAYSHLLVATRHPKCLSDPLEVDFIFNTLRLHRRHWDTRSELVERELEAMWRLDIPIFTARATERALWSDHRNILTTDLALSPLENADRRISRLSSDNRIRQNQYIAAGLSPREIHSPDFIAAAVNYAVQIGHHLCELMRPETGAAPWTTYELTPRGTLKVEVGMGLYHGATGIGLFLAYLDAVAPHPQFSAAARRAVEYALRYDGPARLGAFEGLTGLAYLLTHLAALWDDKSLLERACGTIDQIALLIEEDRQFDVLSGVAGVIPVVLNLSEATGGSCLDVAVRCGDHLLDFSEARDGTLSWATVPPEMAVGNLTGFAHGTAGIGWALIALGSATRRPKYTDAGRKAFAYESRHFDEAERDWYDMRTSVMAADPGKRHFSNAWCNGAAGIGLSRIASWHALGRTDNDLLRDAYTALSATARNFHLLSTDSLCHGRSGNSELFLRMALLRDEPSLQMEANVQVQAQWRNLEQTRGWITSDRNVEVFPGLMLGLSGYGLHFLRLAHPERVPSPLLLDPPPALRPIRAGAKPLAVSDQSGVSSSRPGD